MIQWISMKQMTENASTAKEVFVYQRTGNMAAKLAHIVVT